MSFYKIISEGRESIFVNNTAYFNSTLDLLNELGDLGWEFVTTETWVVGNPVNSKIEKFTYYLKRRVR